MYYYYLQTFDEVNFGIYQSLRWDENIKVKSKGISPWTEKKSHQKGVLCSQIIEAVYVLQT